MIFRILYYLFWLFVFFVMFEQKPSEEISSRHTATEITTPLHIAVKSDNLEFVRELIARGDDINAKNEFGQTPLDIATSQSYRKVAELLVKAGADVSVHSAICLGDLERVQSLVDSHADINKKDIYGCSPLHIAARDGHIEIVKLLVDSGAKVNARDNDGGTPLHFAAPWGHTDIVKLLIAKGCDVNARDNSSVVPLHEAAYFGHKETAELLLAEGADINVKAKHGLMPLLGAVLYGQKEVIRLLIAKGADGPEFHMAACTGDLEKVKSFVEKGADIDEKDELNWTPSFWAASAGQFDILRYLFDNGANLEVRANQGRTLLHQAAQAGSKEIVDFVISKGIDVDVLDEHGKTPLHCAATSNRAETAELLIAKGSDVNAKGLNDWTPLHYAALYGCGEVAAVLCSNGADVNAKNSRGLNPMDLAKNKGHTDIVKQRESPEPIPKDVALEKELPRMIQIQNLSLTDKTMTLDYQLSNPSKNDIFVCYDISVYDEQQIQHAATRIDGETVRIQLRRNIERFPGFVDPYSVVKYIRLKPGESCSGKIIRDLPVKDYVREWREDRKEHKEINLNRVVFEVGYFGSKWNVYFDSLSRRSKKNMNKSNIRKIGPHYYIQLGPDITEETLEGQLREVMYKSELDPFVHKEVFTKMVVTDVTIPCSVVVDDK